VLVRTPETYSFLRTVFSHGWIDLPPFRWEDRGRALRRTVRLGASGPALLEMRETGPGALDVRVFPAAGRAVDAAGRRAALAQVRHILRLDEAFGDFHAICLAREGFGWVPEQKAGPIMRAPDPFEDVVKMICTTNCSWALTRAMVTALVRDLGEEFEAAGEEWRAFPAPEAMAKAAAGYYTRRMKAGYRARYLRELARRVASGRIDPDSWLDPARPAEEIRAEIGSIKGAGRYVVDNMMKLLGRYDGLGLDSWCRKKFADLHRKGRPTADTSIERFYAPFGAWKGLALWCDLTRDWFDEGRNIPAMLRENMY